MQFWIINQLNLLQCRKLSTGGTAFRFDLHGEGLNVDAESLQSGTIRNAEAAQISVPSQVVKDEDGSYRWRTDLKKSAMYWRGKCCCNEI